MPTLWFWLVASMLVVYVILDGFDLGAGAVHLLLARTSGERSMVLRSIGPVWDGNEVWLLAAGGTLYFAFPELYASSFSGFYLPLMLVLWLLVLRGVSIEFRNHVSSPLWVSFWDVAFCGASFLLALFLGVALGNVLRGVPLNQDGWFFEPLWTNFGIGADPGILDWYTVAVGLTSLTALAMHGALWIWLKTAGTVAERARALSLWTWIGTCALTLLVTVLTWLVQPLVPSHMQAAPWGYVFPAMAIMGLGLSRWGLGRGRPRQAFLGSAAYLAGMLASAAFGLFPYVLPSVGSGPGLTTHDVAAPVAGLRLGLAWFIPGMLLATAYFIFLYRRFAGKVEY